MTRQVRLLPVLAPLVAPLLILALRAAPGPGETVPAPVQAPPVVHVADGERLDGEPTVADLGFLSGQWTGREGESRWESSYSSTTGGQIVASSKEMKGGEVVMIDFEHFYERDGRLRLRPYPFGEASVEFTLTDFDGAARKAVFENPENDFPRRFTYQRVSESQLHITLVGDMGGGDVTMALRFERADG